MNYLQHREEQGVCLGLHEETKGIEAAYIHIKSLVLKDVWNNLPAFGKLCATVPTGINAVFQAKGGQASH